VGRVFLRSRLHVRGCSRTCFHGHRFEEAPWPRPRFRPRTSEHLPDYGAQYRWSLVVDFNRPDPVRHRGAGIFLHVNGPGATAGCVSTPRWFVRQMMSRLRPGARPVIAIGR
jgi:L,D-peptidoglycan transpeptidase YkuD (ErfK/YbiS/YcfS/YnhG family)